MASDSDTGENGAALMAAAEGVLGALSLGLRLVEWHEGADGEPSAEFVGAAAALADALRAFGGNSNQTNREGE